MSEKTEYYTIQHKRRAEGPWLKLDEPVQPVNTDRWSFSSFDHFGCSFDPWDNKNYGQKKFKKQSKDKSDLWQKTHRDGWTKLEYAVAALKRVIKDDNDGHYDSFDSYNTRHQVRRHHFRIVKVTCFSDIIQEDFLSSESAKELLELV